MLPKPRFRPEGLGAGGKRALAAIGAALLVSACSPSPESMIDSAKSYLAKNDLNAASIQLKNALQDNGNLAEARFLLGQVNLRQGNVAGAVKELQRAAELGYPAVETTPLLARALVLSGEHDRVIKSYASAQLDSPQAQAKLAAALGGAYLGKGDLAAARRAFEAALNLDAEESDARVGLARTKLAGGAVAEARADAEAALARDAKSAEAYIVLADAALMEGRPADAAKALESALQQRPDNVGYHFALISLLFRQDDGEAAAAKLARMAEVAPNHPFTRYLQAFHKYRNNQLKEARDDVMLALKSAPDFLPAHLLAGTVLMRLNDNEQARSHLNKVLERAPNQALARRLLVASYLSSGQAARAMEALQPLLSEANPDAGLLSLAGQVYMASGDADKAETFFARLTTLAPESAQARAQLGAARFATGAADRAFDDLEAASALDPTNARADVALVLAYLGRRQFAEALAAHAKLEAKQPDNPQTHNLKGVVLAGANDPAKARAAFEKALELKPDFLPAVANLIRLDLADKKPDAARARMEKAMQAAPKNADVLLAYAELQNTLGDPSEAVAATIEQAIKLDPNALAPQLALVRYHLQKREAATALPLVQKLAAAHPNNPQVLDVLGRSLVATGDLPQAVNVFTRLIAQQPQAAGPLVTLADAHRLRKDNTSAEQALRKALDIQPNLLEAQQRLIALLVERKASREALALAKTVQKQRASSSIGYVLEGDIQYAGEKWNDAVLAYKHGLEREKTGEGVRKVHTALLKAGKRGEADKLAADWLRGEPKDTVMRGYLSEFALSEKRYQDALGHLQVLHEQMPKNPLVMNNLAWTASQVDGALALKYADEALALAPDNAAVLDTVGMIQVEHGQPDKGLPYLVRAVGLAPDAAPLRFNLARAYVKVGRKDDARKELDILMPKLQQGTPLYGEATTLMKSL